MKRIVISRSQLHEITVNGTATNMDNPGDLSGGEVRQEVIGNKSKFSDPHAVTKYTKTGTTKDVVSIDLDVDNEDSKKNAVDVANRAGGSGIVVNATSSSVSENTIRLSKNDLDRFLLTH